VTWSGGRALSFGSARGYGLAQRVLVNLLGLDADDPAQGLSEAVQRVMPEQSGRVVTYLARILDLDEGTWSPVCAASPDVTRRRAVQAFVETTRAFAGRQPLVMVWEDLQWIDPSSLELLRALLPLPDTMPLLLVLAFRPEEGPIREYHRQLVKRYGERYQIIELSRLTRQETRRCSIHNGERGTACLADPTTDRSDWGNPLRGEWVSSLKDAPGWQNPDQGGVPPEVPPRSVAVLARLDRLRQPRTVLQVRGGRTGSFRRCLTSST
jgi:hypothetical protein